MRDWGVISKRRGGIIAEVSVEMRSWRSEKHWLLLMGCGRNGLKTHKRQERKKKKIKALQQFFIAKSR